jgi:hypothetical protein
MKKVQILGVALIVASVFANYYLLGFPVAAVARRGGGRPGTWQEQLAQLFAYWPWLSVFSAAGLAGIACILVPVSRRFQPKGR